MSWPVFQPLKSFLEKTFSPFTYDLPRQVEPSAYLIIADSLGCEKDDFGPDNLTIR